MPSMHPLNSAIIQHCEASLWQSMGHPENAVPLQQLATRPVPMASTLLPRPALQNIKLILEIE
jgi:hypothetical protein